MKKNKLTIGVGHVKKALIGMALLALFAQCMFSGSKMVYVPPDGFCTTVGTIVDRDFSIKDHVYPVYEYYVGNKKYQGTEKQDLTWAPYGEKYLVVYDSLYPEDQKYVHLITGCPVFLPGEVTNYTVGKIIGDMYIRKDFVTYEFEYTILGKTYQRIQFLDGRDHPELTNGAAFMVEYWVENPQRAILYADKPKRDGMLFPESPDINVLRPIWYNKPVLLPDPELTKGKSGW
jgi:hypothetical protein